MKSKQFKIKELIEPYHVSPLRDLEKMQIGIVRSKSIGTKGVTTPSD